MTKVGLKQKLNEGEVCIGSWLTLANSGIAEIFCNAGYDWLVVDLEHTTISIDQAGEMIRTIALTDTAPLVRLTSNDDDQIKRVLDAGAHGIVVPMVTSVTDAEKAIAATRYAPEGTRGVGLARAQGYGPKFSEYFEWQKESIVVIAQIEHIDALNHLDDILTTPGLDGFIIGPYDLSCSMGIPGNFDSKEFQQTIEFIRDVGRNVGCPAGIHIVEPDPNLTLDAVNQGYRFVAHTVDVRILDVAARAGLNLVKRGL